MTIFRYFARWRPSAIMDMLCGWLEQMRRLFGSLYHCAKFGWNRCSSFHNMQVLMFCDFGWKMPIHAPFWGFLRHIPQKMSLIILTPKRTVLGRNHVIWAIQHDRLHGSSWVCEEEKRTGQEKKSQKGYISPIWGEAPTKVIYIKMCSKWRPRSNHVCQVSKWNFQGLRFYKGVKFSIFLLISEWALQQCSATVLPVIIEKLMAWCSFQLFDDVERAFDLFQLSAVIWPDSPKQNHWRYVDQDFTRRTWSNQQCQSSEEKHWHLTGKISRRVYPFLTQRGTSLEAEFYLLKKPVMHFSSLQLSTEWRIQGYVRYGPTPLSLPMCFHCSIKPPTITLSRQILFSFLPDYIIV